MGSRVHSDGRIVIESNYTVKDTVRDNEIVASGNLMRRETRERIGNVVTVVMELAAVAFFLFIGVTDRRMSPIILAAAFALIFLILPLISNIRSKRKLISTGDVLKKEAAEHPDDILRYQRISFGNNGLFFIEDKDKSNTARIAELCGLPVDDEDDDDDDDEYEKPYEKYQQYQRYDENLKILEYEDGLFINAAYFSDFIPARYFSSKDWAEISRRLESRLNRKKYIRISAMKTPETPEKAVFPASFAVSDDRGEPLAEIGWKRNGRDSEKSGAFWKFRAAYPGVCISGVISVVVTALVAALFAILRLCRAAVDSDVFIMLGFFMFFILFALFGIPASMHPLRQAKQQLESERVYGGRTVLYEDSILVRFMGDDIVIPYYYIRKVVDTGDDLLICDRQMVCWLRTAIPSYVLEKNDAFRDTLEEKAGRKYRAKAARK